MNTKCSAKAEKSKPLEKKPQVRHYRSVSRKNLQLVLSKMTEQGVINTGTLYIIIIMLLILGIAYLVTGPSPAQVGVQTGTEVTINEATSETAKDRLQLYTFGAATITPPTSSLCQPGGANARPEIIAHVSPAHAQAISSDGRIRIWVNDDKHPMIAPGERITRNSGAIITPGDRAARAPDGYLLEPALYVFPRTADAGGQAYFPTNIRGDYNNGSIRIAYGIERMPADVVLKFGYTSQYTWNVKDLGLAPGSYSLQLVVMDGTDKHAVKCINIRVYETPDRRWTIPD